jgi:hypothetical protein
MIKVSRNNNHQMENNYLIWLLIYFGIGLTVIFIFPFPISLGVFLVTFVILNLIRSEILLRRAKVGGIKGLYKSLSSLRREFADMKYRQTRFYCMNCGKEHRMVSCPRCGSKIKKVGVWSSCFGIGNQKVKCIASDAFSADLVFFLASIWMHQYAADAIFAV